MIMKNYEQINVAPEVRRCFEKANMITDMFDDEYIRTAYVLISIFMESEALINKCLSERGITTDPNVIVETLIEDREIFEIVFGKNAAKKFFEEENDFLEPDSQEENSADNEEDFADKVAEALLEILSPMNEGYINVKVSYSDKLQSICEDAATRCFLGKQNYLDIDNLTYSILQNDKSSAYKMLKNMIDTIVKTGIINMEMSDIIDYIIQNGNIHIETQTGEKTLIIPKNLESCCTVLNNKFEPGVKSDILGREKEKFKLWNIASKRNKRNAVLIGEAGVGKTAIVEALVQDIVNGTCPERFKNYTVLELDVGGTVAGTKYRGELEEKLTKLKKFLENTPNLILFIDEIHQLIGAGSSEHSGFDMSGALKPILARGDVVCIGATTVEEYEKFIAKEQAFKRRFEPVFVKEPKHKEVAEMIKAKVESLSKFHNVTLGEGVLDYIIVCASAFNLTATNPDKSIDLCDRSMSIAEMRGSKTVEKSDVDKVYEENYKKFSKWSEERRKIIAYHEAGHYVMGRITSLKDEEEVIAVSIVPGNGFLGAYIYDIIEGVLQPTYDYYMDSIKTLLAGRISQEIFCNSKDDAGVSSDSKRATTIARKMITEYSLYEDDLYKNVFLDENKDLYDENTKDYLHRKICNVIVEATKSARKLLLEEDVAVKVRNVANLLLEKKIATAKELDAAFNKE